MTIRVKQRSADRETICLGQRTGEYKERPVSLGKPVCLISHHTPAELCQVVLCVACGGGGGGTPLTKLVRDFMEATWFCSQIISSGLPSALVLAFISRLQNLKRKSN